jgi:uncharacterized ferritin-like protein (DUF455 family)
MASRAFPTKLVRGVTLRSDPPRESVFQVVQLDAEMHEYAGMSPQAQRERLHRHMSNEMGSLDIAAQCLADFPDAPWELRLELARQAWDESRHVMALYRKLRALGGRKGEFPIGNFEWSVTCSLDSLPARLAVQNRTFEAGQMDLLGGLPKHWREIGDEEAAETLEAILNDEVQHVRFANRWLKEFVRQDPKTLLDVVAALQFLSTANEAVSAKEGEINAVGTPLGTSRHKAIEVNVECRRAAEFSEDEIRAAIRKAGMGSILPAAAGVTV